MKPRKQWQTKSCFVTYMHCWRSMAALWRFWLIQMKVKRNLVEFSQSNKKYTVNKVNHMAGLQYQTWIWDIWSTHPCSNMVDTWLCTVSSKFICSWSEELHDATPANDWWLLLHLGRWRSTVLILANLCIGWTTCFASKRCQHQKIQSLLCGVWWQLCWVKLGGLYSSAHGKAGTDLKHSHSIPWQRSSNRRMESPCGSRHFWDSQWACWQVEHHHQVSQGPSSEIDVGWWRQPQQQIASISYGCLEGTW